MNKYEGMRPIPHFFNYLISECGKNVVSKRSNKLLSVRLDKDGYPRVVLFRYENKVRKRYDFVLHILSAMTWICDGYIPKNMQVNHIDGDRDNPDWENLEVITPVDNIKHKLSVLGNGIKLNFEDAENIRDMYRHGALEIDLSRIYEVSRTNIRNILKNKIWRREYHG